jgi:hypothetical protein
MVWSICLALACQQELTPRTQETIDKALRFLAKEQGRHGGISQSYPVAATSMGCLAFLASGSTPSRGAYAPNIQRGLEYILKSCHRSGFICEGGVGGQSGMYGHGFATLFLAEALGMIDDPDLFRRVHEALRQAVRLLEQAQNQFGGWNGSPDGTQSDDGSGAVAIMQIMALRAARNAGVSVREVTIDKAKKYLLEMMNKDGWYQYNYHGRNGQHRSLGTTGPGAYMMGAMGLNRESKYEKAMKNIISMSPFKQGANGFFAYANFYASLAMFQRGGADWIKWYTEMREFMIKNQSANGGWTDPYGGLFVAFNVLSLELPFRYLPCFQEGGSGREGQ